VNKAYLTDTPIGISAYPYAINDSAIAENTKSLIENLKGEAYSHYFPLVPFETSIEAGEIFIGVGEDLRGWSNLARYFHSILYGATADDLTTIETGSKTFNATAELRYKTGQRVRIAYTDTLPEDSFGSFGSTGLTNWMAGLITSYNSVTGELIVEVDTISGSGSYANWTIRLMDDFNIYIGNIYLELKIIKDTLTPILKSPSLIAEYETLDTGVKNQFSAPIVNSLDWQQILIPVNKVFVMNVNNTDSLIFNVYLDDGDLCDKIQFRIGGAEDAPGDLANIYWCESETHTISFNLKPAFNRQTELTIITRIKHLFGLKMLMLELVREGSVFTSNLLSQVGLNYDFKPFTTQFESFLSQISLFCEVKLFPKNFESFLSQISILPEFKRYWLILSQFVMRTLISSNILQGTIYTSILNGRMDIGINTLPSYLKNGRIERPFKNLGGGGITRKQYGNRQLS
jgi:hypothetical protein